ncbi:hypothetical protein RFI_09825 [Reticulomyxa filosa]|uniref:Uncharacterized protein n=1 Tax=Reticulomyxa filosa TaxID=46433 RepID=X6NMZ7_RETFI|nr:hypothetical protein RFI_09825 [Reticulomyxa filosa]|eukprot:ETO27308.1 hypothetical protein RFI_09825 [Reticulomyxa filosa]
MREQKQYLEREGVRTNEKDTNQRTWEQQASVLPGMKTQMAKSYLLAKRQIRDTERATTPTNMTSNSNSMNSNNSVMMMGTNNNSNTSMARRLSQQIATAKRVILQQMEKKRTTKTVSNSASLPSTHVDQRIYNDEDDDVDNIYKAHSETARILEETRRFKRRKSIEHVNSLNIIRQKKAQFEKRASLALQTNGITNNNNNNKIDINNDINNSNNNNGAHNDTITEAITSNNPLLLNGDRTEIAAVEPQQQRQGQIHITFTTVDSSSANHQDMIDNPELHNPHNAPRHSLETIPPRSRRNSDHDAPPSDTQYPNSTTPAPTVISHDLSNTFTHLSIDSRLLNYHARSKTNQ